MRHLIKWFCTALIVVTVMRPPGLDAASHRGPTRKKHLRKGANKNNIKYYPIPNSGLDERDGPGTTSQVYSALPPLGGPDTIDEVVNVLANVYNFMEGVTANYFPGSEFVNKFWRLLLYFINQKVPFVESIINPTTIFNNLLYELLKKQELINVDGGDDEETPYDEQYTRIEYNPFKQLIIKFLYVFGEFFGFNPIDVWWSKITQIYREFSLFTEESIDAQTLQYEVKDQDIGTKLGLGAVLTPLSHLAVHKFDPVVFGVNVLLLIVWQLVFLELYVPSLANSIFGDDSDDGSGNGDDGSGDGDEQGSGEGGEEGMDDGNAEDGAPEMENMEGEEDAPDPPSTDLEPPPEEGGGDDDAPDPPADDLVPPPEEGEGEDSAPDPPADDLVPPPEEGEGEDSAPDPPPEDLVPPPEEGDAGDGDVAPDPPAEDLVPPPPPPPPPEVGDAGGNTENGSRKDYYYYSDEHYDYEYNNDGNDDYYYYYY